MRIVWFTLLLRIRVDIYINMVKLTGGPVSCQVKKLSSAASPRHSERFFTDDDKRLWHEHKINEKINLQDIQLESVSLLFSESTTLFMVSYCTILCESNNRFHASTVRNFDNLIRCVELGILRVFTAWSKISLRCTTRSSCRSYYA